MRSEVIGIRVGRCSLCFFALLTLFRSAPGQLQTDAIWPKYHGDASNSGRSTLSGSNGMQKWVVHTGDRAGAGSPGSPVIAADGTIYVGTSQSLMAIDETGHVKWRNSGGISGTPAIAADGTLYVNAIDSQGTIQLASVTPDGGTTKWLLGPYQYVFSSPSIGQDGTVYISQYTYDSVNSTGYLYGYRKDGTVQVLSNGSGVTTSVAVEADGTLVFGTGNSSGHPHGQILGVNPSNGKTVFSYDGDDFIFTPAISPNGNIYVTTQTSLSCLSPTGTQIFHVLDPTGILTPPVIGSDGTVYYGSGSNAANPILNARHSDGTVNWQLQLTGANWINESPTIAADGTLYAPVTVGGVNVIDCVSGDGQLLWTSGPASLPAVGPYGTVVSMGVDGSYCNVYAYGIPTDSVPVLGIQIYPTSVEGGNLSSGTVKITGQAPASGSTVYLSTNSVAATVPPYVVVAGGTTSASFQISTSPVSTTRSINITASASGTAASAPLTLTPTTVTGFTVNPTTIAGGQACLGSLTLGSGAAPGLAVTITCDSPAYTGPSSVTFVAGADTATFNVAMMGVPYKTTVNLTATLGTSSKVASLNLIPPALSGIQLSTDTVVGGSPTSVTGTVSLSGSAPAPGVTVSLSSSDTSVATVPGTVTVPAGASTAAFSVRHFQTNSTRSVLIQANLYGLNQSAPLTVTPYLISELTLNPPITAGGSTVLATVTISGPASAKGLTVKMASGSSSATLPATVLIPSGATSTTFKIGTRAVSKQILVTISATVGTSTKADTLTIYPAALIHVEVAPTSVVGGQAPANGLVTLSAAAPQGGAVVALSSSQASVTVPPTVVVPSGLKSTTFTAVTKQVLVRAVAIITAKEGALIRTCSLTVQPVSLLSLSISPTSVVGSSAQVATGTVVLSGKAGVDGISVRLKSSNAAATVPQTVKIPAGASTANFTISHESVKSTRKVSISATLESSAKVAVLVVTT